MLLSFLPIYDKNNEQLIPSVLDYANNISARLNLSSTRVWLSTYVPLIFANSQNLASRCANLCIDCKGIYKLEEPTLSLVLTYIELPDRFGYLALYNKAKEELLYLCYCGEITLTLAVKTFFQDYASSSDCKNICMVAPIDSIITSEEPYKSEWAKFRTSLMLSSHAYVYLNGSILKCKRIGRQGRDLQVVDKFYVTNKIPELVKALSHTPTCLINGKQLTESMTAGGMVADRLSDRLNGRSLPVARMGMATALSDTKNDADIIVALAKTKTQDAICATLSNDWLKRAVKHKLNKFTPEYTSDDKYEVQQLTTEATIKYQGDSWKGAEKSDLIYVIVEKKSRRPVSIISVGTNELSYIKRRREMLKYALKPDASPVVENTTIEFDSYGLTKQKLTALVEGMKDYLHKSAFWQEYSSNLEFDKTVSWLDIFNEEAKQAETCADAASTITGEILKLKNRSTTSDSISMNVYMYKVGTDLAGRLTTNLSDNVEPVCTINKHYVKAKAHDFNFASLTIKIPDKQGNIQTYEGKVKFGVALLKNTQSKADRIMMLSPKTQHRGVGNNADSSLSLCDYIFPTMPLHEQQTYDAKFEKGYQIIVSNAIYGKKFKDINNVIYTEDVNNNALALSKMAKLASTGIEIPGSSYSSMLSLGYIPDSYEEYCELVKLDDQFDTYVDRSKTVMYSETSYDDSLLDDMDDDYSDLLEDESTGEYLEEDEQYDDTADDSDESDYSDDDYDEDTEEADNWQTQRIIWLNTHPNNKYIIVGDKQIYWFDIMHNMMLADQPTNANNIPLMETIWNSMLSKMAGYTAEDVMKMIYEQTSETDETEGNDSASEEILNDITDDDDDLFADL